MSKTGTKEWAGTNINIQQGCEHNCRYCYAKWMQVYWLKKCTEKEWSEPLINQAKVNQDYSKYKDVVMYPSAHDITPKNISESLVVINKLLEAGNDLLIVSKPHWTCITLICESLKNNFPNKWKEKVTFRFTIGSADNSVLKFWEPRAPGLKERLACLKYAYNADFNTSVSCEPYLDQYVEQLYDLTINFITDSFWIGLLRDFEQRVNLSDVMGWQMERFINPLRSAQNDNAVRHLYFSMNSYPFVRWKDSIRKVMHIED